MKHVYKHQNKPRCPRHRHACNSSCHLSLPIFCMWLYENFLWIFELRDRVFDALKVMFHHHTMSDDLLVFSDLFFRYRMIPALSIDFIPSKSSAFCDTTISIGIPQTGNLDSFNSPNLKNAEKFIFNTSHDEKL